MSVLVVRHACAGDKRYWEGLDADRPLDLVGMRQAEAVDQALASEAVRRILTSPTRRCRDTVVPLARRLGLPVEEVDALAPGDGDGLWALVTRPDLDDTILCTHGELMAPLLDALRRAAVPVRAERDDDAWLLAKGTAWALTVRPPDAVVALRHIALAPGLSCTHHTWPTPG